MLSVVVHGGVSLIEELRESAGCGVKGGVNLRAGRVLAVGGADVEFVLLFESGGASGGGYEMLRVRESIVWEVRGAEEGAEVGEAVWVQCFLDEGELWSGGGGGGAATRDENMRVKIWPVKRSNFQHSQDNRSPQCRVARLW